MTKECSVEHFYLSRHSQSISSNSGNIRVRVDGFNIKIKGVKELAFEYSDILHMVIRDKRYLIDNDMVFEYIDNKLYTGDGDIVEPIQLDCCTNEGLLGGRLRYWIIFILSLWPAVLFAIFFINDMIKG
jgi:hypothetical protein